MGVGGWKLQWPAEFAEGCLFLGDSPVRIRFAPQYQLSWSLACMSRLSSIISYNTRPPLPDCTNLTQHRQAPLSLSLPSLPLSVSVSFSLIDSVFLCAPLQVAHSHLRTRGQIPCLPSPQPLLALYVCRNHSDVLTFSDVQMNCSGIHWICFSLCKLEFATNLSRTVLSC